MALLIVAVCVLALLSVVHLLVTLAVVRRLREHATLLAARPGLGATGGPIAPAGAAVGGFTATSTTGEALGDDDLTDRTLVGFFSPGCVPCRETMPGFLDSARENGGGRKGVLAVVVGESDGSEDAAVYVDALAPVARVVIEPPGGPIATAFGVTGYPALAVVSGNTIRASGITLDDLTVAV